jgi:DNA repair exonuclease SbcCD ATPase subunit
MVEKTITMSIREYEMISIENELYKNQFDKLKQEKMVYLTLIDPQIEPLYSHKMGGEIVEKDELLNRMQKHLDGVEKRGKELKAHYERRIVNLEEQLRQASTVQAPVKTVTKWWHKLVK